MASPEDYRSLLGELQKLTGDIEYAMATQFVNPFANKATSFGDLELAHHLRQCLNLRDAIQCVQSRLQQLSPSATVESEPKTQETTLWAPQEKATSQARASAVSTSYPELEDEPSSFLEFDSLERLLEFVDGLVTGQFPVATRSQIGIRAPRDGRGRWGLLIPTVDEPVRKFVSLFGGREVPALPGGPTLSLNDCLERVPLKGRRKPPGHFSSLFLAVTNGDKREVERIALTTYQSFPQGLYVECQFFPGVTLITKIPGILLFLTGFRRDRRVIDWVNRLPPNVRAYYPLAPTAQNIFYCRWGFRHPVVSLSRLYDPQQARYILIDQGEHGWLKLKEEDLRGGMHSARQIFSVKFDMSLPHSQVFEVQQMTAPVELPLRAIKARRVVAQHVSLAQQIDRYRRALTELERKYEKTQDLLGGQCRVALVFFSEGQSLPSGLRTFLQRPFAVLSQFGYVYLPSPRPHAPGRHILISQVPLELSEILSAGADEIFLQDPRWQGWGINIFCESRLELIPRLDDPAMAQTLLEYLNQGAEGPIDCWLITGVNIDGQAENAESYLIAVGITHGSVVPLPEALRLVNIHSHVLMQSGIEETLKQIVDHIDANIAATAGKVQGVYETIGCDLNAHLTKALEDWVQLHNRIQTLSQGIKAAEREVKKIEEITSYLAPSWEHYVRAVMDLHLTLCQKRITLFDQLQTNLDTFKAERAKAELALRSAQEEIATALATVNQGRAEIQNLTDELAKSTRELQEKFRNFVAARRKMEIQVPKLKQLETTLESQARGLQQQWQRVIARISHKVRDAAARLQSATATVEALERVFHGVKQLSDQVAQLKMQTATAEQLLKELLATRAKLSDEIIALKKLQQKYQHGKQRAEADIQALTAERQHLTSEIKKTQENLKAIEKQKESLEAEKQALEAQHVSLQREKDAIEKERSDLQQQILRLRTEIRELDRQARLIQLETPGLREAVLQLNEHFKQLQIAARSVGRESQQFVADVRQLLRELQSRPNDQNAARIQQLLWRVLLNAPYGFYPSEMHEFHPQRSNDAPQERPDTPAAEGPLVGPSAR